MKMNAFRAKIGKVIGFTCTVCLACVMASYLPQMAQADSESSANTTLPEQVKVASVELRDFGVGDTDTFESNGTTGAINRSSALTTGASNVAAPTMRASQWSFPLAYNVVGVMPNSLKPSSLINLTSITPDADIYYTLDGTDPLAEDGTLANSAHKYDATAGIAPEGHMTIRAVAALGAENNKPTEHSSIVQFYVSCDNLTVSPYISTSDGAENPVATLSGNWERVRYDDTTLNFPEGLTSDAHSLPYCFSTTASATATTSEMRSTELMPVITSGSNLDTALTLSVWRDDTYADTDSVTPTVTTADNISTPLNLSIPLKITSSETAGWYTYYFDMANYAGSSIKWGMKATSMRSVYVDDVFTVFMGYPRPSWELNNATGTFADDSKLKLSLAAGSAGSLLFAEISGYAPEKIALLPSFDTYTGELTAQPNTLYAAQSINGAPGASRTFSYRSALVTLPLKLPLCAPLTSCVTGVATDIGSTDPEKPTQVSYGTEVVLECQTPGAQIYYTTDNTEPTDKSMLFNPASPLIVHDSLSIRAIAIAADHTNVSSEGYYRAIPGPSVEASIPSGIVRAGAHVSFTALPSYDNNDNAQPTAGYSLYYTTDGTSPSLNADGTAHGTLYEKPLTLNEDIHLIVRALKKDAASGEPVTFSYQVSSAADLFEPNDTLETSSALSFPFELNATIDTATDVDYYRFKTTTQGTFSFTLTNPTDQSFSLALYNTQGEKVGDAQGSVNSSSIICELEAGTYCAQVKSPNATFSADHYTLLAVKNAAEGIQNFDFSEASMASHMLGAYTNESYTRKNGIKGLGNDSMSTAYFARWDGPVNESLEPYNGTSFVDPLTYQLPLESAFSYFSRNEHAEEYHLESAISISKSYSQAYRNSLLKSAVYSYGAAEILMNWSQSALSIDNHYFYLPDNKGVAAGHAVAVVGWDDEISKDKFTKTIGNTTYTPQHDGAFIVKNSYGENWGDSGYFYLSYDNAGTFANDACIPILTANDNANVLYQHDPLGATISYTPQSSVGYLKNVFTATSDQSLTSVSMTTFTSLTDYDVYVQVANEDLRHVASGSHAYPGYYTVDLGEEIAVREGEEFSVIVRLSARSSTISLALQMPLEGDTPNAALYAAQGFSYVSTDGKNWTDLYTLGKTTACIKVHAIDTATSNSKVVTPRNAAATTADALSMQEVSAIPGMHTAGTAGDNTVVELDPYNPTGGAISDLPDDPYTGAELPAIVSLPIQFDLRNIDGRGTSAVSSVKNQEYCQTCWCFAAIASAESVLMRRDGFVSTSPTSLAVDGSQIIHLTNENPTATVALTGRISTPNDNANPAANDYVNWSFSGNLDGASILGTSSISGETTNLLTVSQTGTINVKATSAANQLKSAETTITVVDDRAGNQKKTEDPTRYIARTGDKTGIILMALLTLATIASAVTIRARRR